MPEPSQPPEAPGANRAQWAKTVLWISVALIVTVNGLLLLKSCADVPGRTIEKAGTALEKVAAAFSRGTITTSFVSYATSFTNTLRLQFLTIHQMEIFERQEETTTAFGYIPLPEVVVEARAPVDYTYFLDLNDPWKFVVDGNVVKVLAPPIQFNKPAVDASAITYEVRKGYFKTAEAQERLKQSITSLVNLRAREHIPNIRETARRQTEQFVETWLLKSFPDGKEYTVKVSFAGENPGNKLK